MSRARQQRQRSGERGCQHHRRVAAASHATGPADANARASSAGQRPQQAGRQCCAAATTPRRLCSADLPLARLHSWPEGSRRPHTAAREGLHGCCCTGPSQQVVASSSKPHGRSAPPCGPLTRPAHGSPHERFWEASCALAQSSRASGSDAVDLKPAPDQPGLPRLSGRPSSSLRACGGFRRRAAGVASLCIKPQRHSAPLGRPVLPPPPLLPAACCRPPPRLLCCPPRPAAGNQDGHPGSGPAAGGRAGGGVPSGCPARPPGRSAGAGGRRRRWRLSVRPAQTASGFPV